MIDKPDALGLVRRHHIAGHDHLVRFAVTDQAFQPLRCPVSRNQSKIDFRGSKGGTVARDSNIAGTRHFATTAQGKTVDHGDGWFGKVPQGLDGIVSKFLANHAAARTGKFRDIGPSDEGVRFGALPFQRRLGGRPRDHEHPDVIGGFHPSANRLERGHHFGVEGVQFVGSVNGHASKKTDVVVFADGVKVDLDHVAFGRVHGQGQPPLLLHVIAGVQ